jgi:membrane protein YdbS with pleckstrin-like domain
VARHSILRVSVIKTLYAGGMSRRGLWREGEIRIISITPVSRGVVRPVLLTITTWALIIEAASRYSFVHRFEEVLTVLLVVPLAIGTITRIWRWRSHKIHVTTERIIIEGGVLRHQQSSVEMRDIFATRVDQRVNERLLRRGYVYLETTSASIPVGLIRHPAALCRLVDAERNAPAPYGDPLDTVYTYEDPDASPYEVLPDEWQRRRFE